LIRSETLANGARLLLEPVDRTDTLCIGFWYLHGSRDEGEGERGYSHFLEHMLFKGTRSRSALQIAQEIDRVGGIINAFTEKESTCIYAVMPKEHLRLAFSVLSDMASDPLLDAQEIEKEKSVVVNEIQSVDDSPEEKGHEKFLRQMWGGHPLARKITGEVAEVESIQRDKLEAFYRGRFVSPTAIIAVAGNVDPAEVRDLAEAAIPSARAAPVIPARMQPDMARTLDFVPDRFNQVQIYAGTSYPLNHDIRHYYTSLVFSTAFGESMSSRLFQSLREELGLCYTVYSFRTFFSDTGLWTIYANATPEATKKLLVALDGELARAGENPLSAHEIADAKSHLIGSMILSREDMETRMKRLVRQHTMIERVLEFDEAVSMIESVSPQDVEAFVRGFIRREAFGLLAFGTRGVGSLRGFEFSF
jgi:predicted Zn-dependent peptidase